MAAIAKQCFAFFLLAIVFSGQIQARDSQFFNKVPSNNADREAEIVAAADSLAAGPSAEPSFVPENENGGYGLYGHNAGQLPPAGVKRTTTPKYLPKNYNVEGYVTVPEGYRGAQPNENENGNNRFVNAEFDNGKAEFDNNKNPNFYKSEADQNFGETSLYNNNNKVDSDTDSDDSDDFNNDGMENTNFYDSQKENSFYQQNNDKENQDPNVKNVNYEPFNSKKNFNLYGNNGESEQPEKFDSKNFNTYGNNGESQQPEKFDSKKNFNLYGNSGNNYYNAQNQQQNNYNGGLEGSKFADSSKYESFDANNNGGNNGVQKQGMSDTRFLENGKYFYDVNMEQQKYSRNYNRPAYRNNYNSYNQAQEQDLP